METAWCGRCRLHLPTSDFYLRPDRPGGLQKYCKSCLMHVQKIRWNRRKREMVRMMGDCCFDCGGTFHPACYDLHHLDPSQKKYSWSKLRLLKWETIERELPKCRLLCGNCHRLRHVDPSLW